MGINYRNIKKIDRVDYDALSKCLKEVFLFANENNLEVHMPKIGSGLAGGDWKRIETMIINLKRNVKTIIYVL